MDIKDIDRTKPARERRFKEFLELKALPWRTKEQEGRYQWLAKQKRIDAFAEYRNGK
jgi:hypothetical protein